ncbi:MAG TPA: 5'-nucleotidase [Chthonomonadaceae bacterium]|nr:5'-nucleotidase [Chthonomonadaceae bacterium]
MPASLDNTLVVAISSRALFNFEEENKLFEQGDESAYMDLQWRRVDNIASPGVGFNLCRKLLALNESPDNVKRTEIVVLSRNDPISGLRVFKSAAHHGLAVTRGAFLRGGDVYPYLAPFRATLFLSADPADVKHALDERIPAATVQARTANEDKHPFELRIAFDGDSVLFSDEAERVFRAQQLAGFRQHEAEHAGDPLPAGPIQPFLLALHKLQSSLPTDSPMKIKTALVTSRGAPAHERALRTLVEWRVSVDNAFFLDGLAKTEFLNIFSADFFFDDQLAHVDPAAQFVGTGHVPYGIANAPTQAVIVEATRQTVSTQSLETESDV